MQRSGWYSSTGRLRTVTQLTSYWGGALSTALQTAMDNRGVIGAFMVGHIGKHRAWLEKGRLTVDRMFHCLMNLYVY